jgi:hypothetical protein
MIRAVCFALLAGGLAAGPSSTGAHMSVVSADTLGRFPSVEGSNLEGRQFALPAGFEGELNVVLVAFQREQQADVDSWMPFLTTLRESRPGLKVYELPTLGRRYRMMRPFIDGGMRRGIPDRAVRESTITLYIDKSPFREALQLGDEDRIYVLLVDRQGRVRWRAQGRFDERAAAELARRSEEARSGIS